MNIIFNLTKWPAGYGLDIETEDRCYGFAGKCGGGAGRTEKSFTTSQTQLKELRSIIDEALKEVE